MVTPTPTARAARLSAMDMARRFIAGTNTREVLAAARREREMGRGFTLDILGETVAWCTTHLAPVGLHVDES